MDEARKKRWNADQKRLQAGVENRASNAEIIDLFLPQHALVHAGEVSGAAEATLDDEIWQDLSDPAARAVPPGMEHSIAWMAWHLARCEDITMNLLAAGAPQVLDRWLDRLGLPYPDTGNTWDADAMERFNRCVPLDALRAYRAAVGRRTREIVRALPEGAFQQRVDPSRAAQILPLGAVREDAIGLVEYWSGRTIGGLLLMPATRHHLVHWNEALTVKRKLRRMKLA